MKMLLRHAALAGLLLAPLPVVADQFPAVGSGNSEGVVSECLNASGKAVPITGGTCAGGVPAAPYAYTPLTPSQNALGVVSSTALTVPSGATYAVVCVEGAAVRWTWDGTTTPTASVGTPAPAGSCVSFSGATVLANLRFIQQAATATLDVEYAK